MSLLIDHIHKHKYLQNLMKSFGFKTYTKDSDTEMFYEMWQKSLWKHASINYRYVNVRLYNGQQELLLKFCNVDWLQTSLQSIGRGLVDTINLDEFICSRSPNKVSWEQSIYGDKQFIYVPFKNKDGDGFHITKFKWNPDLCQRWLSQIINRGDSIFDGNLNNTEISKKYDLDLECDDSKAPFIVH